MNRRWAEIACVAAVFLLAAGGGLLWAQDAGGGITVFPLNLQLGAGQRASTLTVQNHRDSNLQFQIRAFAWNQQHGTDGLVPTDALLVSPPLGTVSAGGNQVVRLVLKQPADARETSFRILLDEIPPPARPGAITIALRLSIPIFVKPETRVAPNLSWSAITEDGQTYLVAVNDGTSHEVVHDLAIASSSGRSLRIEAAGPYVLPGATRRWRIDVAGAGLSPGNMLHLTAKADSGPVDLSIELRRARP
jgi:fimbrial chaperone protein